MKLKHNITDDSPPRVITINDPQRLADLVRRIEEIDGHVTIFKFSTCWQIVFGTPNLYGTNDWIATSSMDRADTFVDALEQFFRRPYAVKHMPVTDEEASLIGIVDRDGSE